MIKGTGRIDKYALAYLLSFVSFRVCDVLNRTCRSTTQKRLGNSIILEEEKEMTIVRWGGGVDFEKNLGSSIYRSMLNELVQSLNRH